MSAAPPAPAELPAQSTDAAAVLEGDHRLEQFAAERASAEWETVARKLLSDAARAFLGRAAQDVANQGSEDPAPINPLMLIEASVLAR